MTSPRSEIHYARALKQVRTELREWYLGRESSQFFVPCPGGWTVTRKLLAMLRPELPEGVAGQNVKFEGKRGLMFTRT